MYIILNNGHLEYKKKKINKVFSDRLHNGNRNDDVKKKHLVQRKQ